MRKYVVGLVLVGLALGYAGCSAPGRLPADGVPDDQYLVGGGFMIEWEAPADGTAYLVEKTTGKIIETRSMQAGDHFSFSVTSRGQADDFEQALGIDFGEARFLLYFQPLASKGSML